MPRCDFCGQADPDVHTGRGPNGLGSAHPGCETDFLMDAYESAQLDRDEPLDDYYP